jgi:hypothetical protein
MKQFKDLKIKLTEKKLIGDSIDIEKILGKEIVVEDFRIEDTRIEKFRKQGSDKCLWMQFLLNGEHRVVFSSSKYLMEAILQVQEGDFPFTTTIVEKSKRFEFT